MKRNLMIVTALLALTCFVGAAVAADYQYVGAGKCFMCHKKDKSGNQMQKWMDGPHAGAFKTLATDEAKAIATEKGLGDPQQAAECLKCHVTAADAPAEAFAAKFKAGDKSADHHVDGVGCEACHGAGSKYKSAKVMKAITGGTTDGATVGLANAADEAMCRTCHNEESPTFIGFDFAEFSAKIAHPIPEAHKATYAK